MRAATCRPPRLRSPSGFEPRPGVGLEANVVTDVGMVLGVAAVTSVVARAARQPTIVGYLLAGLLVGPHLAFPLFADHHRVEALAELGVVLVMFAVGLELRLGQFIRSLPATGLTGLVQVGSLVYVGFVLGSAFGWTTVSSLFLGTAIAISSTMVVTRVFAERRPPSDVADHVISVLVLQDVVAIILIAAMTGVAQGGGLAPADLALLLLRLGGVLVAMAVGGLLLVPPLLRVVARIASTEILTVFSVGLCFAYAVLAQQLGYSVALGAFIAGVVVAESGCGREVEHVVAPLRDVFAAIFFVSIGMTVDPTAVWAHLPASLAVALAVIVAQLVAVGSAGVLTGLGARRALMAGLALGQIGEFGFILAAIGAASGVVDGALQPILVTVAVITSLTTPIALRHADRVVGVVDRLTPARLQHLLGLYESWVERVREAKPGARSPLRRAFVFLVVDALAIIAALGVAIAWLPELTALLVDALSVFPGTARLLVAGAVILASLPFLRGVVRNAAIIARTIGDVIVASATSDEEATSTRIALHGLRALLYLAIVVGLGFPAVAALRPLMDGYYAIPILGGVVVVLSVILWRRAGRVDDVFRSGARELAERIAKRARVAGPETAGAAESEVHEALIPGLDGAAEVVVDADSALVGKSLRELGLRSATGATIVAIDHHGHGAVLPTGSERLAAGDVCVLAGTTTA
ncbi:MAG: potassium transporter, partial [Deltaproteobacteria bacterium]